jgi:hypothetical protein
MWWPAHQIQVLIRLLHSPPSNTTAAGAGAFFVCCWSYALPPKRRDDEEDGKYLDNDGHITVAGETYQGGSSVDSQSGIHRTQQLAMPNHLFPLHGMGEEVPSRR